MLTEDTIIGEVTVSANGDLAVRTDLRVLRDGVVIATTYHRHVISPGHDLQKEDARVRSIGRLVHTPEIIAAYKAASSR